MNPFNSDTAEFKAWDACNRRIDPNTEPENLLREIIEVIFEEFPLSREQDLVKKVLNGGS